MTDSNVSSDRVSKPAITLDMSVKTNILIMADYQEVHKAPDTEDPDEYVYRHDKEYNMTAGQLKLKKRDKIVK